MFRDLAKCSYYSAHTMNFKIEMLFTHSVSILCTSLAVGFVIANGELSLLALRRLGLNTKRTVVMNKTTAAHQKQTDIIKFQWSVLISMKCDTLVTLLTTFIRQFSSFLSANGLERAKRRFLVVCLLRDYAT